MSFRSFIYCCTLCGGWAAFFGWILGRAVAADTPVASAAIKGMCLGTLVGLALGLVDTLWNYSLGRWADVVPRVLVVGLVSTAGGLIGGAAGQALADLAPDSLFYSVFHVVGWTITGLLVGASLGAFDVLHRYLRKEDRRGALRKVFKGCLGGTIGGLLGGVLSLLVNELWGRNVPASVRPDLWSPSALGFAALGLCIGLMIGLAQVLLREAWVRVEAGFRAGRELIVTKPEITIGRGEGCDIGLFGDAAIDRLHARILLQGDHYVLADADSAGGTYVNDARASQPVRLRSGDLIRVGNARLRFEERRKAGAGT